MPQKKLQEYLFDRIREKLSSDVSLADTIAENLHISTDSAYRRIRGETLLVLEEAHELCDIYQISLDHLLREKPEGILFLPFAVDQEYRFENYLQDILRQLQLLESARSKEIIYLSKDLPFFYNFLFPPLSDFHYFFWMKSIIRHPDFLHARFTESMLPHDLREMGNEIMQVYAKIPSIEIWNTEAVNSTIAQIEYYREADYFDPSFDIGILYRALELTLAHLKLQAEYGAKFLPREKVAYKEQNYQFFYNRLVLADNTIVATANGKMKVFVNYDVLNYMMTENESFCRQTHEKMHNLMKRGTLLSQTGDKQRNIFFNMLLKKIPGRVVARKSSL